MYNGMEIATQGLLAMMAKQDVIANNLANVGTAGFQKDSLLITSFDGMLNREMGMNEFSQAGFLQAGGNQAAAPRGQLIHRTATHFTQGSVKNTGNPFDLTIDGDGFFNIQTRDGVKFTRNGAFNLGKDGFLATKDGNLVLGQRGPIKLAGKDFAVDETGTVSVDGKPVDRLALTRFVQPQTLKKTGDSFFVPSETSAPMPCQARVKQGFLEMSNVNAVKEMVEMMTIMRAYEANQKLIQQEDQMIAKSVNETGKVRG
ncbi:MAG: flagellar basal-body rod protein FlgF [Armatimonadetes bacterium]|nr:flagellar basal-body rod protein FlgF [Armatimonadota bacterium]